MNEYDIVEPVVSSICESLESEPEEWFFNANTIQHRTKFNCAEFWIGTGQVIDSKWNGFDCVQVFSDRQGSRIYKSYLKGKATTGTIAQKELLDSL